MEKNAQMRANTLGRASSSFCDASSLNMARRMELLIRRSLRPMMANKVFLGNTGDRRQEYPELPIQSVPVLL